MRQRVGAVDLQYFPEQVEEVFLREAGPQEEKGPLAEHLGEAPPELRFKVRHAPVLAMAED
jgi:hypothetical protein